MKEIKNIIICGFPGVGKSSASQMCRDVAGIESTAFHWPTDWENINEPDDSQLEMGFNPYEGAYDYDC